MDGAGKKLLIFMESAQQQLGGGVWLDMRAQMRSLDQSANNNHSHTNSSQEKDHLHNRKMVISKKCLFTMFTLFTQLKVNGVNGLNMWFKESHHSPTFNSI